MGADNSIIFIDALIITGRGLTNVEKSCSFLIKLYIHTCLSESWPAVGKMICPPEGKGHSSHEIYVATNRQGTYLFATTIMFSLALF